MNVFVAGATGVLGRRLVVRFHERGHRVMGLARNPANEALIRSLGGEPRAGDLFDADSLARAAEGAEVVVHAATAIPSKLRTTASDWAMNDRIRRDGTRALTAAASRVGARQYIQESIVWVAQPTDGSEFDEDTPLRPPSVRFRSAVDAESISREAGNRDRFAVSIIRCGMFYSADAAHTRTIAERVVHRRMPILGRGDAVWGTIHADDAANAFVTVAEASRGGLWHVVDDRPVTSAEFTRTLADWLSAPAPARVPVWLARWIAGREEVNVLTSSTRTSNARFRRELGWVPQFPTIREGFDQIVGQWKEEGFPPR